MSDDVKQYLNDLRDSGVTNMWGAGAYLQRDFGMTRYQARDALLAWIESFKQTEKQGVTA
jgi:hypothetical protein